MKALLAALAATAGLALAMASTSCGQDEGDRCQVNSDCASGLICNQATKSCARTTGGDIDATVPIIDASIDAPDDAAIDAPADAPADMMLDAPDAM